MANYTINSGKAQWNVKAAKSFRDIMAIWHVFDFELADRMKTRANNVAMFKGIIASDSEKIEKKDFSIHDEKFYLDDIQAMTLRINDANRELSVWKEAQEESVKTAEKLFSKSLYKLYVASVGEDDNAWRVSAYTSALADLLAENGVCPTWDILDKLYHCARETKGNGRSKSTTGRHNKELTYAMWRAIIMGKVCDEMGDILPTYKWVNVFVKKAEKKAQ